MADEREAAGHAAAGERAHARLELGELERLGEVVVGAGIQAGARGRCRLSRAVRISTGTLELRARSRFSTCEAGLLRQPDIEDQQVELVRLERGVRLVAAARAIDRVARLAQRAHQALGEVRIVLG